MDTLTCCQPVPSQGLHCTFPVVLQVQHCVLPLPPQLGLALQPAAHAGRQIRACGSHHPFEVRGEA